MNKASNIARTKGARLRLRVGKHILVTIADRRPAWRATSALSGLPLTGDESMTTRRSLMVGAAALSAAGLTGVRARAEPVLTEDGLYRQPWFLESFLELADDL